MKKQDPYRFNLKFDEFDEDHRRVCEFLNACGRKKARYIVKAVLSYWDQNGGTFLEKKIVAAPEEKQSEIVEKDNHLISIYEDYYSADQAEVSLMMKNYQMFDSIGEGMAE